MNRIFFLTVADGKKLIARGILHLPYVREALAHGRLLITAGTTNCYVARAILNELGDTEGFDPKGFYHGITTPKGINSDRQPFIGEIFIDHGRWVRGKSLSEIVPLLREGDVICKGGNAVNLDENEAAVLVGHPQGGTVAAIIPAVIGQRARLLVPIGVEKRVRNDLSFVAAQVNDPGVLGPRLAMLPGAPFTEIDALCEFFDDFPQIVAAGGTLGAEGGTYFLIDLEDDEEERFDKLLEELRVEPEIAF